MNGPRPHVSLDDLLDYYEARLSDEGERGVEEHLADCTECARLARQVYAGTTVLEHWTADAHAQAAHRAALALALESAAARPNTAWRERLERWRHRWSGAAEAAARIVIEGSAAAGRVLAVGLDALSRPGSDWHLVPELQAAPVRGVSQEGADAAVLTTPTSARGSRARVAVTGGDAGEIVIRVDDVPPGAPLPLVLLITPSPGAGTVQVAVLERPPHVSYAVARFEDLPPGEYVVAFEPMEVF